jgi:hypothetical protein
VGQLTVSSRLATVGLVVLAAATVGLVGVALRSNDTSGVDKSPVSSAGTSSTPSDTGSAASSPTAPATATAALAAPLQTMLVAIDDKQAWRVHTGSCSAGGATLATTSDGGRTWTDTKAPLRAIVRVRPTDAKTAFVIGADTPCAAELSRTTDGGGTWASTKDVGSAWFRDPKNPKVVGGPGSSTSRPCDGREVLDLAVLSTSTARVLCADGVIRSTANTGSTWTGSGNASGAVALAVLSSKPAQIFVARVNAPDCAGVQIWRVDRRAAPSCITTSLPENPGQISLSLFDGGGWLAVGDTTRRSTDGLVTWSAS